MKCRSQSRTGKRFVLFVVTVLLGIQAWAQENRYMVFFSDKEGSPYELSEPVSFLSQKAVDRRLKQNIPVTEQDLPVSPAYVQAVRDAGATVFFKTRWMNGVLVQCEPQVIPALEALSFVDSVRLVAPGNKLVSGGRSNVRQRKSNSSLGTFTAAQLSMLGIDRMHEMGHRGEGITVAVLDAGFMGVNVADPFKHLFVNGQIEEAVSYDFVYNTSNVFRYDDHGTHVLSVMAAEIPGTFTAGIRDAAFQLYVTEDVTSEYRIEEYNWLFAAERADSAGADIIHTSLGYYDFDDPSMNYSLNAMDGVTPVVSQAAQYAADRGILVVCSAGNEGNIGHWKIITAPADARDVLAVGNVNINGEKNPSSSIGPTSDGRIKPDLAALGTGVRVIRSNGTVGTSSGTSLAAPLVTSLAAGVWQRYPHLTNKELMALLKQTASQAAHPDHLLGYGIPDFNAVVNFYEGIVTEGEFNVYPNPVKDTLTVYYDGQETGFTTAITLISSLGSVVWKETLQFSPDNRDYRVNLAGVDAGLYYLTLQVGNKRYTYKVVKL